MRPPRALDLCCGLGGWAEGLIAAGWEVAGIDIEARFAKDYPGNFWLGDVRQFVPPGNFDAVVASPPCQEFSRHDQPWTRKRNPPPPDRSIWEACVQIARDRNIPLVIENVRGAQRFMGRAMAHVGPYYLWGDVPAIVPKLQVRKKESLSSSRAAERAKIPFELAYWVGLYLKEGV